MATYEEKRDKGFIDVVGLLIGIDEDALYRYCVENRLILRDCYDTVEEVMNSKGKTPVVIKELGIDGYEKEFVLFKLIVKRGVILIDGEINELTAYIGNREREYQRETMQKTRDAKGYNGGYVGGYIPYGYYHKDKKLYIDDYESFIVKFVFYRHSQGCSVSGITKELNLRKFKNRNGNKFTTTSVKGILDKKRLYQGYTTYKGKEVKAEFRGILEDTADLLTDEWKNRVFDAATEARISKHRERYHSENSVPNSIKPYILVGEDGAKKKGRRDR